MSEDRIDFETLNAYVDGELDLARRAEIADAIAREPHLARQVAALSRLKSEVAESVETADLGIDLPDRRPRARRRSVVIAASIAVAFAAAGAIFVTTSSDAELAWAVEAHESWAGQPDRRLAEPKADVALAALSRVGASAYVPELTAAKLRIAHIDRVAGPAGGEAVLVGYRGTRGCKISLLVAADAPDTADATGARSPSPAPEPFDADALHGYRWRAGGLAYVIIAEGMDKARFSLIAKSVYRASLERAPVDPETRMALARSRAESPPCMA